VFLGLKVGLAVAVKQPYTRSSARSALAQGATA
jgi:hypothetical protein